MDSNTDLHMSTQFANGNEYIYYLEYIGVTQNNLAKAFCVDGNGNFNWTGNIVTFSTVVSSKSRLVSDVYSNGVSVLAWSDGRQDAGGIYSQNIQANGLFGGTVPVELISFYGTQNGNQVNLQWQTATESNNSGFEIERASSSTMPSQDGWEKIGFIPGFGTTTERHSYSFTDNNLLNGIYHYRLKQIDYNGNYEYSDEVEVEIISVTEFSLSQNYPNPFNPTTNIVFQIADYGYVSLKVYDVLGNEVATIVNEYKTAGNYEIEFNASMLPSGVYFYELKSASFIQTKKMLLMK